MSVNAKIFKTSFMLILISILGNVFSLVKEMNVSAKFGISSAMDAYYAGITIPNLINQIFIATFAAIFIPVFIKYRNRDRDEANRAASIVMNWLLVFLLAAAAVLYLATPWVIRVGFHGLSPDAAATAIPLLRLTCSTVVLSGVICILVNILNANEFFALPAFSQLLITIGIIAFVLLFAKQWGVMVLIYGLLAGLAAQIVALLFAVRKAGFRYYFDFNPRHPAVREMLSSSFFLLAGVVALQLNVVIDRVMASGLSPGSISALGYADKLIHVPLVVFSTSIATAIFPFFSNQVAEKRLDQMNDSLEKSVRIIGFIFIPLTLVIALFAQPMIQILFQRGAFTREATDLTSVILIAYSFQIFFFTAFMIFSRALIALGETKVYLKLALFHVVAKILLNLVFLKIIRPPAAGIALSTSVVLCLLTVLAAVMISRHLPALRWRYILRGLGGTFINAAIMGGVMFGIFTAARGALKAASLPAYAVLLVISIGAGTVAFLAMAHLIKMREISVLREYIAAKFASRAPAAKDLTDVSGT